MPAEVVWTCPVKSGFEGALEHTRKGRAFSDASQKVGLNHKSYPAAIDSRGAVGRNLNKGCNWAGAHSWGGQGGC